ncbi:MAG: hypothetical protein RR550_02610, partial [Rikenellaceae bacterium]
SASHVYLAAIEITSIMVLPAYLFTPIYLFILIYKKQITYSSTYQKYAYLVTSVIAIVFCAWMMTSSDLNLHLLTFIFYILGIIVFFVARREHKKRGEPFLKQWEWLLVTVMMAISIYALVILIDGKVKF